jgi:hypothetical protein
MSRRKSVQERNLETSKGAERMHDLAFRGIRKA